MKLVLVGFLCICSLSAVGQYTLDSFLTKNDSLDASVDSVFSTLSNDQIIAQLLMPAIGRLGQTEETIKGFTQDQLIGGVLMLNGTKEQFTTWINDLNTMNQDLGSLPYLYSADAEPSLVNRKIIGSKAVPKANAITSLEEVSRVANVISNDLNDIGINYNFAPVVDMSTNKTVGYRGFGSNPENIIPYSNAFIAQTQHQNIIATAKHFPGHGLISGDTHKALQMINGEMKEVKNYIPLIEEGVISIMVAHIAVTNNEEYDTKGMPATTSKTIVTDLLRDSLQFKGLIVTDAMNMGGVSKIPDASVKAIEAGCDIILMPLNVREVHKKISEKYTNDVAFKETVDLAAKRIIRAKLCIGIVH